jgi:hypothetical protein
MIGSPTLFRKKWFGNDDDHSLTTTRQTPDDTTDLNHPSCAFPSRQQQQRQLWLDTRRRRHVVGLPKQKEPPVLWVWIPLTELSQRRFELPPRHVEFAILVDTHNDVDIVREQLSLSNHQTSNTNNNQDNTKPKRNFSSSSSWNVSAIFVDSPELWTTLDRGPTRTNDPPEKDNCHNAEEDEEHPSDQSPISLFSNTAPLSTTFIPYPRLWEPDSMVADLLFPTILQRFQNKTNHPSSITMIDLGAGIGRDACFLAEQCYSMQSSSSLSSSSTPIAIQIWALDQRYRESTRMENHHDDDNNINNNPTQQFWNRRGVGKLCQCVTIDLNDIPRVLQFVASTVHHRHHNDDVPKKLRDEPIQNNDSPHHHHHHLLCIYAVRFYHRPLLQAIWDAVPTGTLFGISHFVQIDDTLSWNAKYSSPKESKVLSSPQELPKALANTMSSSTSWTILHDRIEWEHAQATGGGGGGRPLQQMVAMKN